MVEARRHGPRALDIAAGLAAGLAAIGLLATVSLPISGAVIAGVLAGGAVILRPHLGLYGAAAVMLVFLPGMASRAMELALALAALLWALAHRRRVVPRDGLLAALGLMLAAIWASALAVGSDEALRRALAYSGAAALYWAAATLAVSGAVLRRVVQAMVAGGLLIALIAIAQLKFPFIGIVSFVQRFAEYSESGSLTDAQLWDGAFRVESLSGGPNLLGISMQIVLPFAFFWAIRQPTPARRVGGLLVAALMAAAMLLSLTRGVMVTTPLVIVPVIAAYLGWRRSLPYLGAAGLATGVAAVAWAPLRTRLLSNITEWTGGNTTLSGTWRLESVPYGLRMFEDHFWLGAGLEQQVTLWSKYAPSDLIVLREMVIHNDYLLFGIELGIGGLLLLLLLLAAAWRSARGARAHFRATGQRELLDYAVAAEASWLALAANLMLYPLLHNFRYVWVLLALIGMLARIAADQRAGITALEGAPAPAKVRRW